MSRNQMLLPLQFKQVDTEDFRRSPFSNKKMVSEIYFPRMLSTKVRRRDVCAESGWDGVGGVNVSGRSRWGWEE